MKKLLLATASALAIISATPALASKSKPAGWDGPRVTASLKQPVRLASLSQFVFAGGPAAPLCGGFLGAGDTDSNFNQYWAVQAFRASTCGLKVIRVIDETTSTQTDIRTSATDGTKLNASDVTSAGCNTDVCKATTIYGYGAAPIDVTQATDSARATLTANCPSTGLYCLTFPAGSDYSSTSNVTVNNGSVLYFVGKQTATDGGNREIMAGPGFGTGTAFAGYHTSDHPECFEGGAEIVGTTAIGSWGRELCTLNGASSSLVENGTNHAGTLTSNTASNPPHIGNSNFTGQWIESGINSTTMGSTLSTLDGNIHTRTGL